MFLPVTNSTVLEELNWVDDFASRNAVAISFFGSARIREGTATYELARDIARCLAESGYTIISGGGPGIMRAVMLGTQEVNGQAIGFHINLPFEPLDTSHQNDGRAFDYFFTRKLAFAHCSHAFVVLPGGMGTLDELFDILTLMQTGKIPRHPVVLVGSDFWAGLLRWMRHQLEASELIDIGEIEALGIADSPEDVSALLSRQLSMPKQIHL